MSETALDHLVLLRKYMDHVSKVDGTFFIPFVPNETFSRDEITALEQLAVEIVLADHPDSVWKAADPR